MKGMCGYFPNLMEIVLTKLHKTFTVLQKTKALSSVTGALDFLILSQAPWSGAKPIYFKQKLHHIPRSCFYWRGKFKRYQKM